jgi:hypothetical protein
MIISDGKKIKVYNGTADTISANKVVIVKGKTAHLASYTDDDCKVYPLGYTLSSISPGQYGEVILEGSILNINTSAYGSGNAILYLSTSGNLTVTKPSVPIIIATISKNDSITGEIYFKVFTPSLATWGDVLGNITDQEDLQEVLDDKVPYTGATGDVNLGTHSVTMSDGVTDTEMSPAFFGVENNAETIFSLLEYNQLTVNNSTIPSSMAVTATGITFPDSSIQETAFPPTGGTDTQYIKGDGTLGTLPNSSGIPKGTTSGTNTYTTTISGVTSLSDGDAFLIRFTTGNTTSCTLNINSLGAIPLYRNNDGELIGGDIIDGAEMLCVYNSSTNRFQVIGTAPNTLLAYVTNDEATTITKGQAVYAFGGTGDRLKVKLAYNTSDATSAQTIGVVLSTSIAANQKGLIIMQGQIDGLNLFPTSTWADGDAVYLGATAGSFSKTKPLAPNHLVYLGFVTTASNGSAGRMYVRVQNGYELNEIHDVALSSPANHDILKYNLSTDLWENTPIKTINGDSIIGAGNELIFNSDRAKYGYEHFTDFIVPVIANNGIETAYTVFFSGTGAAINPSSAPSVRATNQHGFILPNTGTAAGGYAGIYGTLTTTNWFLMGGGVMSFATSIFIPTLSTSTERYRIIIGYGAQATNIAEANGMFFTYDEGGTLNGSIASANWQCVTSANSVRTLTTSTVAANNTAWQKLSIEINAAGTSVQFLIDNVVVATHTTNIPAGTSQTITPKLQIVKAVGATSRTFFADYFSYKQTYTTSKI